MKLQYLSVIFIIIIIPIILLLSYYISLQIDTIKMQSAYTTKQLEATKEAVEAFEINTVEWNENYSSTADSKRRDIMASINTFTDSFANSIGIGRSTKETVMPYIPAIAVTLYDGYYIYSPAETKEVIKDENGVAVFDENGEIKYGDGTTYSHILKPFSTYSARYEVGNTDIVVNYTLDNYITVSGIVNGEYEIKSGYLIDIDNIPTVQAENLTEKIWYKGIEEDKFNGKFTYVYAEDNTKVYFDNDNTAFTVNSNRVRTNLKNTTSIKYKKLLIKNGNEIKVIYQALNSGEIKTKDKYGETIEIEIKQGDWYTNKKGNKYTGDKGIGLKQDGSARNYYIQSENFSNWVYKELKNIKVPQIYEGYKGEVIFKENDYTVFEQHKREVIKQTLISDLNQAITSYSRNSEGEYELPMLSETDWDQILRNVSIITFVQDIPIGLKKYNNYAIATSTSNKEYVNVDEIYLSTKTHSDGYYHMPYCDKLESENVIGYRNIDYVIKSYETENKETKYYYKHSNLAEQACYYCIVQRSLYKNIAEDDKTDNDKYIDEHKLAYDTALARERYVTHEFRNQEWELQD